jgi:outer membrane lipopolysaccharide assembly protein LptE/RlpB
MRNTENILHRINPDSDVALNVAWHLQQNQIQSVSNVLLFTYKICCLSILKENFITTVHTVIIEGRVEENTAAKSSAPFL